MNGFKPGYFRHIGSKFGFSIHLFINDHHYTNDEDIAKMVGISKAKYRKLLNQFNPQVQNKHFTLFDISNVEEVIKCLNEEYEILLKLL